MFGISFARWDSSHGSLMSWYRVYWNWKWTPLVWGQPRYMRPRPAAEKGELER